MPSYKKKKEPIYYENVPEAELNRPSVLRRIAAFQKSGLPALLSVIAILVFLSGIAGELLHRDAYSYAKPVIGGSRTFHYEYWYNCFAGVAILVLADRLKRKQKRQ